MANTPNVLMWTPNARSNTSKSRHWTGPPRAPVLPGILPLAPALPLCVCPSPIDLAPRRGARVFDPLRSLARACSGGGGGVATDRVAAAAAQVVAAAVVVRRLLCFDAWARLLPCPLREAPKPATTVASTHTAQSRP